MPETPHLAKNYQSVTARIKQAHTDYACSQSVQLLAVSKTKPIKDVNAIAALGQVDFGENYVQEALDKIAIRPDLTWHFIGPIQSNKTKPIAENFSWVHSVDRLKIATRLNAQRPSNLAPLNILLEINISEEDSKSGFSPRELLAVLPDIIALKNCRVRGLMAIPLRVSDFNLQREPFAKMKKLLTDCQRAYPNKTFDTLSMGMSADLEAAICEGATFVRIGTDIFGARNR